MTASNVRQQGRAEMVAHPALLDAATTREEGCVLNAGVVVVISINIPCAMRFSCAEGLIRLLLQKYMLVWCASCAAWRRVRVPRSSSWTSSHQWCSRPSTCSAPPWPGGRRENVG